MNSIVKDAAVGLSFAGIGSLLIRFYGYNQTTMIVLLYLVVVTAVFQGIRHSEQSINFSNPLHRLVLVSEGEEMRIRKLLTGEKYKIKGSLEKL